MIVDGVSKDVQDRTLVRNLVDLGLKDIVYLPEESQKEHLLVQIDGGGAEPLSLLLVYLLFCEIIPTFLYRRRCYLLWFGAITNRTLYLWNSDLDSLIGLFHTVRESYYTVKRSWVCRQ